MTDSSKIFSKLKSGEFVAEDAKNARSDIWELFQKIKCTQKNEYLPYVKCKKCDVILSHEKGAATSNFKKHKCMKLHIRNDSGNTSNKQLKKVPPSLKTECTKKLVFLCAKDLRSFNIVTGEGFRDFVQFCLEAGAVLGPSAVSEVDLTDFLPHPTTISRNAQTITEVERGKLSANILNIIAEGKLS